MPRGTTHGLAKATTKGEDNYAVLKSDDPEGTSVFSVFDGHGGKHSCTLAAKQLAPALQDLGAATSNGEIENSFWMMDSVIAESTGAKDGSTATILLVANSDQRSPSRGGPGGGLTCTMAWVGDSVGVAAVLDHEGAHIIAQTSAHTTTDEAEQTRLKQMWQVQRAMRLDAAQKRQEGTVSEDDHPNGLPEALSPEEVVEIAKSCEVSLSMTEAKLMLRAIDRGNRIDMEKFGTMDHSVALTSVLAPRHPGGKPVLHKVKQNVVEKYSDVTAEIDLSEHSRTLPGAQAVDKRYLTETGNLKSVSTCVTRALGDWDGSRALVPHPEVLRFAVGPQACVRVVLASDGLWDFVTPEEAVTSVLATTSDVTKCAEKLLEKARDRSNRKFNELKDDITIVVVELNPSGLPPPLKKEGGCCVVS